ncbi:protein of unknown function [Moritella yayanosii]|uniref:Uncharacterized protein n=1 Tax=Moritella yayanosii TaxID=69539 RepID=A0A330LRW6_9GAMM|nr:protein of unknown function [Moritella yayanosii]
MIVLTKLNSKYKNTVRKFFMKNSTQLINFQLECPPSAVRYISKTL